MRATAWAAATAAGAIVALVGLAHNAANAQPRPPVAAFTQPAGARLVEMAPGGAYFSAVADTPRGPRLRIYRLTGESDARPAFTFEADVSRDVLWTRWVAPDRLIVSRRAAAATRDDGGPETRETRLFAVNADGRGRTPLIRPDELTGFIPRIQDDVIDILPRDPSHILLAFSNMTPNQPDVVRVNVRTGESRRVERSRAGVRTWMTDAAGAVRLGRGRTRGGQPHLITRTDAASNRWRDISYQLFLPDARFEIVGFAPDPTEAYVISNHEGAPAGLYVFDLDGESFGRRLYRHTTLDVAAIAVSEADSRVVSVRLGAADGQRIWLDDDAREAWAQVNTRFARRAVEQVAVSLDGAVDTVRVSAPSQPGAYYFYDRRSGSSRYAGPQWPGLAGFDLAAAEPAAVQARDGVQLPAQLLAYDWAATVREGRRAPFVIMPHAGPGNRDLAVFDPLAQFFAAQGLVVLQINIRGTGADALAAGGPSDDGGPSAARRAPKRALGRAMVDDVADAAAWALEQGYADPSALLVAGRGFGAYAALQAAADAPGYFACVVALDAVSDLSALTPEGTPENERSDAARLARRLWPTPAATRRESPVRRAPQLSTPVFVAHARDDVASPFTQSLQLAQSLRRSSGDFEFLDVSGDDDNRDPKAAARFYGTLATFAQRCMGEAAPQTPTQ